MMAYDDAPRNESSRSARMRAGSLSSSLPPSSPTRPAAQHRRKKQLSSSMVMSSEPISLPKSHIHRTPSELQLADDIRRAEYEDVRMYARLVVGMQSQCVASGYVHPLTRKSLQDIVKTKEANDQELETMHLHHHEESDDNGWDVNYIEDQEEQQDGSSSSMTSQLGAGRLTTVSPDNVVKTQSGSSLISSNSTGINNHEEHDEGEEEGVFSMEL